MQGSLYNDSVSEDDITEEDLDLFSTPHPEALTDNECEAAEAAELRSNEIAVAYEQIPKDVTAVVESLVTDVTAVIEAQMSSAAIPDTLFSSEPAASLLATTIGTSSNIQVTTNLRNRKSSINYYQSDNDDDSDDSQVDFDEDLPSSQINNKSMNTSHTHPTTSLECTLLTPKDVCKTTPAQNRKSKTINQLGLDYFKPSCIGKTEAKLRSDAPIKWYEALRSFARSTNVKTRVENMKKQKNQKVSILKLRMTSTDNKSVQLQLNFVTGVLHVKCLGVSDWIQTDFSIISESYKAVLQSSSESKHTSTAEKSTETVVKKKVEDVEKRMLGCNAEDNARDIGNIWNEIEALKTALKTIDETICTLSSKIVVLTIDISKVVSSEEAKRQATLQNLQSTVAVYQETVSSSSANEVKKLKTDINNKFFNLKTEFRKLEESVEEKMKDRLDLDSERNQTSCSAEEDGHIQRTADLLERGLNELDKSYEEKFESIEAKLTSFQRDIKSYVDGRVRAELQENSVTSQTEAKLETLESQLARLQNQQMSSHPLEESGLPAAVDDISVDDRTSLIICMDSNGKHLDRRKLWDLDGTKYVKTYTLDEVNNFMDQKTTYPNLKYFLISVGCNDCDNQEPQEVTLKLQDLVTKIKTQYPQVKVIVGEITPRKDRRDEVVKEANVMINRFVRDTSNLYIIRNSNMRNTNYTFHEDNKHFAKECIAKFAANIKHALRIAYGRKKFVPSTQHQTAISRSYTGPTNHQNHYPQHRQQQQHQQQPQQQQQQHLQQQDQQQQQQQQQQLQQLLWNVYHNQNRWHIDTNQNGPTQFSAIS